MLELSELRLEMLVPWIWRWLALVIWCCVPSFRGIYGLHLQGRRRKQVLLKQLCISTCVDGVVSHKTIVTSLGTDTVVILPETNDGKVSVYSIKYRA